MPRKFKMPLFALAALIVLVIIIVSTSGHSTNTEKPAAALSARPSPSSAPPPCHAQVASWRSTSGSAALQSAGGAIGTMSTAAHNQDTSSMAAAMDQLGRLTADMRSDPIPACADPHAYWSDLITQQQRIANDAPGVRAQDPVAVEDATTALQQISTVARNLTGEIQIMNTS